MFAPFTQINPIDAAHMAEIRIAADSLHKISLDYSRADGKTSERIICPLGLFFWGGVWTIGAWCELREGFRVFRLDRIRQLESLDEKFSSENGKTLNDFIEYQKNHDSYS